MLSFLPCLIEKCASVIPMFGMTDSVTGERTQVGLVMDMLKNPVTAIILAAAYLIWLLGASLTATQKDLKDMMTAHMAATDAIKMQQSVSADIQRVQLSVLRKVCIGVNKAKPEICGDDK